MSNFKIGDSVRIAAEGPYRNSIGFIHSYTPGGYSVYVNGRMEQISCHPHDLELVEDTSGPKPDPKSDPNSFGPEIKTIEIKVSLNPSSPETEAIQAIAQIMDQYQDCNRHSVAAWFSTKYGK